MSFLDRILKRKEERRQASVREREVHARVEATASVSETVKTPASDTDVTMPGGMMPGVLRGTHVSEKTARIGANRQYAFIVRGNATKPEVRRAVEARYGVKIESVNVLNTTAKLRRRGRQVGYRPGFRKAIVTVAEGATIEVE